MDLTWLLVHSAPNWVIIVLTTIALCGGVAAASR